MVQETAVEQGLVMEDGKGDSDKVWIGHET